MEIVVKVAGKSGENAEGAVARLVREALGKAGTGEVAVSAVFPGAKGRRAGMFMVRLPDTLSKTAVDAVLDRLRSEALIEYADFPATKRPMGPA